MSQLKRVWFRGNVSEAELLLASITLFLRELVTLSRNPALEDQACDRIYRVGQHRNVTIHRFICEGTVEDKISSLQEKKKELASKVLSGTGISFTKLSLADLRVIFGI
ncbi:hypothetical protein ANANG_G00052970 [Anguilla anguilla]|uniref:Helicase C-terminal domain-containing protein n=1 Tax=Anguilla anguilla TaxID=7936 RepID=A0A9D3MQN6_ANGAN|nr:hypothetical protein ANANG_G00052970 [Anguilla anguilla]